MPGQRLEGVREAGHARRDVGDLGNLKQPEYSLAVFKIL
jgi:hypothetical protein